MLRNYLKETDFSRRRFIQLLASVSLASMSGAIPNMHAWAESVPTRKVPLPKFNVRTSSKTAAELYQCKPDLKRFGSENMDPAADVESLLRRLLVDFDGDRRLGRGSRHRAPINIDDFQEEPTQS